MPWQITGDYYAPCSCNIGCPCLMGALEGDHGWCSGMVVWDIKTGMIDDVDVTGAQVAALADWPSGFLSGNGTGRIFFDPGLTPAQKEALTAICTGKRGGLFAAIGTLIPNMLPPEEQQINVWTSGDESHIQVGNFVDLVVKPLRGPSGEVTRLLHGAATFREDVELARSTGHVHAPGMREWQAVHGEKHAFDWSGT